LPSRKSDDFLDHVVHSTTLVLGKRQAQAEIQLNEVLPAFHQESIGE
jgi:hypothetical protein